MIIFQLYMVIFQYNIYLVILQYEGKGIPFLLKFSNIISYFLGNYSNYFFISTEFHKQNKIVLGNNLEFHSPNINLSCPNEKDQFSFLSSFHSLVLYRFNLALLMTERHQVNQHKPYDFSSINSQFLDTFTTSLNYNFHTESVDMLKSICALNTKISLLHVYFGFALMNIQTCAHIKYLIMTRVTDRVQCQFPYQTCVLTQHTCACGI